MLAAGAGTRAGGPKALLRSDDGMPWLALSAGALLAGGCTRVIVVLGALEHLARPLVPVDPRIDTVTAPDWADGMSASLRAGLLAAFSGATQAAVITLVDLPGLPAAVVQRLASGAGPGMLRQAVYAGRPGHPVVIGADHWGAVADMLSGDRGARAYLVAYGVKEVECGDLWDGEDRDEG